MLSLTLDEGVDEIDGSEINPVRARVLKLLARTEEEMTDVELMGRAPDELHFTTFCLETLGRLPSEVAPLMGCREWTHIRAHGIVRRAIDDLQRAWSQKGGGNAPGGL